MNAALKAKGIDFDAALRKARATAALPRQVVERIQLGRFYHLLQWAASEHPASFKSIPQGDGLPQDDLLPPMSKEMLRSIAAEAGARKGGWPCVPWSDIVKRTSGSTGPSLRILKGVEGIGSELAATWRAYGWVGVELGDPGVRAWSLPDSGWASARSRVKARMQNYRIIATRHLRDSHIDKISHILESHRPVFIYGYSSAVAELARLIDKHGLSYDRSVRSVIVTSEPLLAHDHDIIARVFTDRVAREYGASEVGSIANDCIYGSCHIAEDNLLCEVVDRQGVITRYGSGKLLLTDLTNLTTPIIRYLLGDEVVIDPPSACGCGLPFSVVSEVRGRTRDVIRLDGRPPIFASDISPIVSSAARKSGVSVLRYKMVYLGGINFRLEVVFEGEANLSYFQDRCLEGLQSLAGGEIELSVQRRTHLPRSEAGKYSVLENRA